MANHSSAEKRNRQNQKRRTRNAAILSKTRKALKEAREAILSSAAEKDAAVKAAIAAVYRASAKNVWPVNAASRTVGRLMKAARASN